MSQHEINGVVLEIDMEDVDFLEKLENAFEKMGEEESAAQKIGKQSDIARAYCKMFYHLFDNVFGEGTGQKIFAGKNNLRIIDETYEKFISICAEQTQDSQKRKEKIVAKFQPNRAQRRKKQ